jgi:hypothetical protein
MGDFRPIPGVDIIGITGRARSGKDELAKAILRMVAGAERFAFSDAVAVVARTAGMMGARDAATLQRVGTQMREIDPDIWCTALYGTIEDRRPDVAVVTGIRHQNEHGMIRAMRGRLIGVRRPGAPALTDRDPSHPVEQGIDALVASADNVVEVEEMASPDARDAYFDEVARYLIRSWLHATA